MLIALATLDKGALPHAEWVHSLNFGYVNLCVMRDVE